MDWSAGIAGEGSQIRLDPQTGWSPWPETAGKERASQEFSVHFLAAEGRDPIWAF